MKKNCEKLAEIFRAMSHPIRVRIIIGLVEKNECNVMTMAEKLEIPQPAVSHHLNILKNAGLVTGIREGNQICYRVIDETVKKMLEQL